MIDRTIPKIETKNTIHSVMDANSVFQNLSLAPSEIFPESICQLPSEEDLEDIKRHVQWMLNGYGISFGKVTITPGVRVSLYEVEMGLKSMKKVAKAESELLISFSGKGTRIINPLPGKAAIGIEIPNPNEENEVRLTNLLCSEEFLKSDYNLPICIGIEPTGNVIVKDLDKIGHLLIGGDMQKGKTSLLRQILFSLLIKKPFTTVNFAVLDTSSLDLSQLKILEPIVGAKSLSSSSFVIHDEEEAIDTLRCISSEITERQNKFKRVGVRNIYDYNQLFLRRQFPSSEGHWYMPYLVVLCDEFHPINQDKYREFAVELEKIIQPIASIVGVHCIFTSRYMMNDTITKKIANYFPTRICFSVDEKSESKLMLGNEIGKNLLADGDIIFNEHGTQTRCQTAKCDDYDIMPLLDAITEQIDGGGAYELAEADVVSSDFEDVTDCPIFDRDPLLEDVARQVVITGSCSSSAIQRRYEIGYNRASRIMDQLERLGIVGSPSGGMPRPVLVDSWTLETILNNLER